MTPQDYRREINLASLLGYDGLAQSLLALYRRDFPQDFVRVEACAMFPAQTAEPTAPNYFVRGVRCGDFSGCSQ